MIDPVKFGSYMAKVAHASKPVIPFGQWMAKRAFGEAFTPHALHTGMAAGASAMGNPLGALGNMGVLHNARPVPFQIPHPDNPAPVGGMWPGIGNALQGGLGHLGNALNAGNNAPPGPGRIPPEGWAGGGVPVGGGLPGGGGGVGPGPGGGAIPPGHGGPPPQPGAHEFGPPDPSRWEHGGATWWGGDNNQVLPRIPPDAFRGQEPWQNNNLIWWGGDNQAGGPGGGPGPGGRPVPGGGQQPGPQAWPGWEEGTANWWGGPRRGGGEGGDWGGGGGAGGGGGDWGGGGGAPPAAPSVTPTPPRQNRGYSVHNPGGAPGSETQFFPTPINRQPFPRFTGAPPGTNR